jgi:hypothetical protein
MGDTTDKLERLEKEVKEVKRSRWPEWVRNPWLLVPLAGVALPGGGSLVGASFATEHKVKEIAQAAVAESETVKVIRDDIRALDQEQEQARREDAVHYGVRLDQQDAAIEEATQAAEKAADTAEANREILLELLERTSEE